MCEPMNVTCRVVDLGPERFGLCLQEEAEGPDAFVRLLHYAMNLPRVVRVEMEAAAQNTVIVQAADAEARAALLQMLRGAPVAPFAPGTTEALTDGKPAVVEASAAIASEPGEQPAPVQVTPAQPTPAQTMPAHVTPVPLTPAQPIPVRVSRSPFVDGEIVHALPGRQRMRVPVIRADARLAAALAAYLGRQPGVRDVRVSRASEAVIVKHDAEVVDGAALLALTCTYEPDESDLAQTQSRLAVSHGGAQDASVWQPLAIVFALLALAFSFFGAANWIVLALLLAGSWQYIRRAVYALVQGGRLSFSLLAIVAVVLLGVTGHVWQAALLIVVMTSAEWLRSSRQAGGHDALALALSHLARIAQRNGQVVPSASAAMVAGRKGSPSAHVAAKPPSSSGPFVSSTQVVRQDSKFVAGQSKRKATG